MVTDDEEEDGPSAREGGMAGRWHRGRERRRDANTAEVGHPLASVVTLGTHGDQPG